MTRRTISPALAVTFATAGLLANPALAQDQKPNILVIFGDDIGIANVSAYSDGVMGYTTPTLTASRTKGLASCITTVNNPAPPDARHSSPGIYEEGVVKPWMQSAGPQWWSSSSPSASVESCRRVRSRTDGPCARWSSSEPEAEGELPPGLVSSNGQRTRM